MSLQFDPIEEAGRNWETRGWEQLEAMLWATSITRAHQILHARIDTALAPLALNFSRFEVLALLSFTREGELPMGKIGSRLQVHPASVTNTISRLEADHLVERVAHPKDRRTTLAKLRPQGRVLAERGADALASISFGIDGLDLGRMASAYDALVDFRRSNGDFV